MDGFGRGGSFHESSQNQSLPVGASPAGDAVFDASQYAFFGGDMVEEVELGGLGEDDDDDLGPGQFEEEEIMFEKEEEDALGYSEIDDLSSTFSKLNKFVGGPAVAGASRDWGSSESLSAVELAQDSHFPNWVDERAFDTEANWEAKTWSSHQYSSPHILRPQLLHRVSPYPEQPPHPHPHPHPQPQRLHHDYSCEPVMIPRPPDHGYSSDPVMIPRPPDHDYSSEVVLIPRPPFTPHPPGGRFQHASPNGQPNPPICSPNFSPFSVSQAEFNALPQRPQFGGNLSQVPHGSPINNQFQNQWASNYGLSSGNRSALSNNFPPQLHSHQNGAMPQPLMPPNHSQQTSLHPFQQSIGRMAGVQPHFLSRQLSASPPMMNNIDMLGLQDLRDPKAMPLNRTRHGVHYPNHSRDYGSQRGESGWPRFTAKYMSPNEIENILRMQLAATHSSDPYVDDYYHQACLARKSSGAKLKHHFCPIILRDGSSKPRASNEQHAFLQVDALGRVSFASIRRPRPLLEVDSPNDAESKVSEKPLDQEPMLAARVTIEDGFCLLLDLDDIDRFLQFNQLQDGGAELRQKRQAIIEGLASSLHLVDPLGRNGNTVNVAREDDLLFLRIVSLPKGRKLLLRYLKFLLPGEHTRVVSMAIFRNLRFMFGGIPTDPEASMTFINLAKSISACVHTMELKTLAACLASVACSSEQPSMHPVGHPAGDGASVIIKSVLDRATELLTNPDTAGNCTALNRQFWQVSFNAFFTLLMKYCFHKYDSVAQSFVPQGSPATTAIGSDAAKVISREMPVELLRASLPHTNEQQKKLLLEFAKRSMPALGSATGGGNGSS